MSPFTTALVGVAVLLLLLAIRLPIGFAMIVAGFAGIGYLRDIVPALKTLSRVAYNSASTYYFCTIPLFLLMGEFASRAGLTQDLYETIYKWLGRLRGGLAMATIGGCAGFAAVCGSSLATAASMCKIAYPEMKKYNYDPSLSTGTIAAGGTLGVMIPPSLGLIIYGMYTDQSIGKLLLAGFLPGFLIAFMFIALIYIQVSVKPSLAPLGPKTILREKIISLTKTWPILFLFGLVIGGIYGGVFTPTEAAAVGAFVAMIIGLVRRRLNWQNLHDSVIETTKVTAMLCLIIIGGFIMSYFLAVTKFPMELAHILSNLPVSRYVVLIGIIFLYIILGCFLEGMGMLVLTIPVVFPVITGLGFDPIWFGVIATLLGEIGMLTPPVGINVFVVAGSINEEVPLYTIFKGILPFMIIMLASIVILTVFPQIALFLPNLMK